MKVNSRKIEQMLLVLSDLGILKKQGQAYRPRPDFDLIFRGYVLKRARQGTKIMSLLVNAMVDSLETYGFFKLPNITKSDAKLAIRVLFTFSNEKWSKIIEEAKNEE
jgi:hypothetical protein